MIRYSNILVIQTAFIGDAILATSVVEKLHAQFPEARLSMLVRKGNESLFTGHPYLHEVLVWNKREKKLANLFAMMRTIRKKKFDCVINCHRYASSGFLAGFSGARHIAGFKQNPFSFLFNHAVKHVIGDGRHEIQRYNELIADFTHGGPVRPGLYPTPEDRARVLPFQARPYVCMAPASVWKTKQLPEHKWVELCGTVSAETSIFLLGAPEDKSLCERIAAASGRNDITVLAGTLTLLQSCALMQKAEMNFVNDSAPLHLASAINAPVTAFFCSTVPEFGFGPLSDVSIVKGITLPCRPCGIRGYDACPLGHFRCGNDMPVK